MLIRKLTIGMFTMLLLASQAQATKRVEFFYSDVDGIADPLNSDTIQQFDSTWTRNYDIYVRNTGTESIEYLWSTLLVGYATSNGPGVGVPVNPGSDKITIFDPAQAEGALVGNPNVAFIPAWVASFSSARLAGGIGGTTGQPRPYGLATSLLMEQGESRILIPGDAELLLRVRFRVNGLQNSSLGSEQSLYLYSSTGQSTYSTSLVGTPDQFGINPRYTDSAWQTHSRLSVTVVPEPSSLAILGFGVLAMRRTKRGHK